MNETPRVVRTVAELRTARAALDGTVAVVMTMGALHEGHATLMREARAAADHVVVTIFVNPLQFGVNEDLSRYPRPLEADLELCAAGGVDLVFAPSDDEMYPTGAPLVRVSPGLMGTVLEGVPRPTHFEGVLTVVAKLLHLTQPHLAFFGQKDAQQLALVRRMVADLAFDVEIRAVPIVREPDGLARSSRNSYLSEDERHHALVLSRACAAALQCAQDGGAAPEIRSVVEGIMCSDETIVADYFALVDPATLAEVGSTYQGEALLLVAARVGSTRLIDNTPLDIQPVP